jgi:choline-sulfatase
MSATAQSRPNILYIMTDQQHAGMMSCTGNPHVKTPAMDSIAKSGVRFELAYAANPVCLPARTSMITGRYPSHFGIRTNGGPALPEDAIPHAMGHVFRKAGYRTLFGGKTHWPQRISAEAVGFEYYTADERDELADRSAAILREKHDQPFLMVVSLINPHDICYMAIDAYTKARNLPVMYPKSVIERRRMAEALQIPSGAPLPPLPPNHGPTRGEPGAFRNLQGFRGYVRKHWGEEDWRRHRWAYCRLTERVDAEVGRVLAALRENGLDRNTVLVFSSDHGDMDSAHGFEHKSLPYEESARVPFIVSWPGHVPAGRMNRKHLVSSSTDLLPTLCDYAGIQPPAGLPGRSVRAIVSGQEPPNWRDDVVIECNDSRSLRTRRYKYTVWDGDDPRETLFDMQKDPGEMNSLVNDKAMAGVLADHRARLRRRIEERTDDYGRSLLSQKS